MIIKELTLHNFGVYAGSNTFSFDGQKPIVLIGGMNGRGKTTFLEAVLLALYGSNSFAYTESTYKSYGQYLKSFVNQNDGTLKTYISLEFTVRSENVETYRIQRSWSGEKIRVSEQIQVWKNGVQDDFLTENWSLFIENLIPNGLSNFFFFDGEKIAELAVEETSEQMKESIKILLGVSIIDSLQDDLSRVAIRTEKQQSDSSEAREIDQLRAERDQTASSFAIAEQELATLKEQRMKTAQQVEAKQQEYSAKGGDIYAQRQELYAKRATIISRIETLEERLVVDAATELPLSMVRKLLQNIYKKAEAEHEQKLLESTLKKLDALFEDYIHTDATERETISKFIDYVRGTSKPSSEFVFDELSDSSVTKLKVLLDSQLEANCHDVQIRKLELMDLRKQKDQLDNYLSVEIDEKEISTLYRQIKELEQKLIELDVKIQSKEEECKTLNTQAMTAASTFKRNLEFYIKKVEFNDDSERILKYSHMASEILDEYTKRMQMRKVSSVAQTMTDCYKSLANKTTLIDHIEMDPVSPGICNTLNLLPKDGKVRLCYRLCA